MAAPEALQECVEIMATLQHTTARITRSTTDVHTNINNRHTNTATHRKNKTCTSRQHGGWTAAALCVAPVSKMPDRQAAQATGSVLPAQPSLRRAGQRGPRQARPNRRARRAALDYVTTTLQNAHTKNSHSHMHIHKLTQTLKCSNTIHIHIHIHIHFDTEKLKPHTH